jgi:hypothetical protein
MNYNYIFLYTTFCLILFWIIIKWGTYVINRFCLREGLTDFENYSYQNLPFPKDAIINYNDVNSPLYSQTVNLPINDPISCKNFCGPKAQCLLTREQCTSDIDCFGCNPGPKPLDSCATEEVAPYEDSGKLSQNQGLHYSSLTSGYNMNFAEIYPGSKSANIIQPYLGVDTWTKSFNEGLAQYNKKQKIYDNYQQGIKDSENKMPSYKIKYPLTESATGQFYETTPPGSNAYLV